MKRLLLTAILALSAVIAFAGNPLKIVNGKDQVKTIMKENTTVVVEFDWSQAKYDNKKTLKEQWEGDYDYIVNDCEESFIKGFNENAKKLKMAKEADNAKYKFVLTVTNIDRFFAAMAFIPQHEAKMWGTLTIVDIASNQTLAEVRIDEAEDGQHVDVKQCFGETFEELGEKIAKLR